MKYWAYVNNEILGPFEKEKLLELPSFSPSLLVCPQTPVGEKTEDWKEAATYPELSALLGSGASLSVPKAAPTPEARPAPEQPPEFSQPAAEHAAGTTFKPMVSSSIEQTPPAGHGLDGINISVNTLGKAHAEEVPPATSAPHQSSANFDPISLSQIVRRTEPVQPQEAAAPAGQDPLAKEPQAAFSGEPFETPKPAQEIPAFTPAAQPKAADEPPVFIPASSSPELETFSRPAAAYAQPDKGAMDALAQKIDALARNAATKQDLSAAIDPFRLKLDQMGEIISSMKGSQLQREIMDKLAYLENSLGEIKASVRSTPAQTPEMTNQQEFKIERNSDTAFGVQSASPQERSAREAAKEAVKEASKETAKASAKPMEIVDQGGSKSSKIGSAVKKLFKLLLTLALLAAVLLGAVIGLKRAGVFDATVYIPFPVPFAGASAAKEQPAPEAFSAQPAQPQAGAQPAAQPAGQPAAQPEVQAQAKTPDLSPQIIYFTRTYHATPSGPNLENKISEISAAAGGDYGQVNWQVKQGGDGIFEIAAMIPSKTGDLAYTFIVDYNKKSLLPADDAGKAAFAALSAPARRAKASGRVKKQPAAAKARPKKAAAKGSKAAKTADEYEYVYEEDDGTGK